MAIAAGQDLYACLFDPDTGRFGARSLGTVTAVVGDSVTCSGLVFNLRLDHVFETRADAERAADFQNRCNDRAAEERRTSDELVQLELEESRRELERARSEE